MKIILALIPNKEFSKELVKISNNIASQVKSEYINGKNNIPHCSILQFETKLKTKEIHKLISNQLSKKLTLTTSKPYQRESYSTKGKFWFGLDVKRTKALENLQKELIKTLDLKEEEIHNKIGKKYNPHFSTGMTYENKKLKLKSEKTDVKCTIHICSYGKNYAVKKILI